MQLGSKYRRLPQGARVMEKKGVRYPSVTTVLSAVYPIIFPEYKLRQYAARGWIVHAQIRHFLQTGRWERDLMKIPRTEEEMLRMCRDIEILRTGSLGLSWHDCNFPGFWEKHGKLFKPWKDRTGENTCFNDQYRYFGTSDWPCLYKDEPTMVDFKTSMHYPAIRMDKFFKQTAAYSKCEASGEIKQMVIVPINPGNKCGFGRPMISRSVDFYFNWFARDRLIFNRMYGF